MSAIEIVRAIEKTVKQYGFLIVPIESGNKIVEHLRKFNMIQLFRVNKTNGFIVLELNVLPCDHECNTQCHNYNGYRDDECFTECVYACREERLRTALDKIKELS